MADNYIFELDKNVTRTHVSFENRYGVEIAADIYTDKDLDASAQSPALIIGHPYGGVKEQSPGLYAQILARRGFVVLTFDASYNGFSGDEPRHVSSPDLFVEDFSAAVDYLGTRPFVARERIGVIGICGSGGFALGAAQVDPRIKAVATVSMHDISRMQRDGFNDSMTDEVRREALAGIAEQRWEDFEAATPTLTDRGAAIGFDENTDPISREFGEFYSTPQRIADPGHHQRAVEADHDAHRAALSQRQPGVDAARAVVCVDDRELVAARHWAEGLDQPADGVRRARLLVTHKPIGLRRKGVVVDRLPGSDPVVGRGPHAAAPGLGCQPRPVARVVGRERDVQGV